MEAIEKIDTLFSNLESKDNKIRYDAFQELLTITDSEVEWVYDKWLDLIGKLSSDNSYQRSIGLMLLANLAKSDHENRISEILLKFFDCFNDEKFITSRQCIQSIWKIAICNKSNCGRIVAELERTYYENIHLRSHGNLIKDDVIFSLSQITKHLNDKTTFDIAKKLIADEIDPKIIKSLSKHFN